MKNWSLVLLAAGLGVALACDGSSGAQDEDDVEGLVHQEVAEAAEDAESDDDAVSGAPVVSDRYQSSINRGWEKAVAGDTPAYACAGLKGRVMSSEGPPDVEAQEALFACNVLLPVRYFETYLERIEAGETTCRDLRSSLSMQLPAMTLSLDSIQGMADAMGDDPEAEPDPEAAGQALAGAVDRTTMQEGLEDPERLIKDRLEEPVRRICPDEADSILR